MIVIAVDLSFDPKGIKLMLIKKVVRKGKNLFKRLLGLGSNRHMSEDIQKIKGSNLFNETYYFETYPDVNSAGVDAATHYYLYGAKELRNPSARFNTGSYLSLVGDINENPLVHCIDYMASHPDFVPPGMTSSYIDDIAAELFGNECAPLKAKVALDSSRNRINLFLDSTKKRGTDNAVSVSFLLAVEYCNTYNFDLRIISNKPANQEFNKLTDDLSIELSQSINIEFFAKSSRMYIDICPNDIFICTDWRSADCILNTPNATGKIFYVVDDINDSVRQSGDIAIKIHNILENDQVIPVVCSKLLYDYLLKEEFYGTDKTCVCLDAFTVFKALAPSEHSFSDKEKYQLVLWGNTQSSSMFYFGVTAVNEALKHNIIVPEQWSVTVVCDNSTADFKFDMGVDMKIVRDLTAETYAEMLSSADFCLSFAYGPVLTQIVIDAALAGAVCLTNKHPDRNDLCGYSDNIITIGTNAEAVLDGMRKAVQLAKNAKLRKANYENMVNICKDRNEALSRAVRHMKEKNGERINV